MNVKNFINYIPMTSISAATFTGSYQLINSTGVSDPCIIYKIVNNSTVDVTISLNGTVAHDFIPTLSASVYDPQAGRQPGSELALLARGQKIYVKGSAGTGSVYLVGIMSPASTTSGV